MQDMRPQDYFSVALKVIGAYLLISGAISLINVSLMMLFTFAPQIVMWFKTSLPLVVKVVVGFYLLVSGQILIDLAFKGEAS